MPPLQTELRLPVAAAILQCLSPPFLLSLSCYLLGLSDTGKSYKLSLINSLSFQGTPRAQLSQSSPIQILLEVERLVNNHVGDDGNNQFLLALIPAHIEL